MAVMNAFTHEFSRHKTYLYVPAAQTGGKGKEFLFNSRGKQSGTNHAEDEMKNALAPHLPQEFWITYTQCPSCARNLIDWYKDSSVKPVIHAVHFYSTIPNELPQKDAAIQCLAKMKYYGFEFKFWDWNQFNTDFIKTDECKNLVSIALQAHAKDLEKEQFDLSDALLKADRYIDQVNEKKMNLNDLCKP